MLIAYGIMISDTVKRDHHYEQLREKYPIVSLEDRLPSPPKPNSRNEMFLSSPKLKSIESEIERKTDTAWLLKQLHTDGVSAFVNSPGFGNMRMERPSESSLAEYDPPLPIHQFLALSIPDSPSGEILSSGALDESLSRLHLAGVIDFVNPNGFGYVKSRTQVAGFRSHRFSEVPKSQTGWTVNSVELVGILVHEQPAVYVSVYLPRMDELKKTKTRPLDPFENEGLVEIEKGEELFVRGCGDSARMMGAIRNAKQCVECHGGNRGDLLGAFSYRLKKQ